MPEPVLLRWVGLRSAFLSRGTGHSCCWAPCFTPSPPSTGALVASCLLRGLPLLLALPLRPLAARRWPGIGEQEALWLPPGCVLSVLEELRGPAPSAPEGRGGPSLCPGPDAQACDRSVINFTFIPILAFSLDLTLQAQFPQQSNSNKISNYGIKKQ